jgi:hypothetical protein
MRTPSALPADVPCAQLGLLNCQSLLVPPSTSTCRALAVDGSRGCGQIRRSFGSAQEYALLDLHFDRQFRCRQLHREVMLCQHSESAPALRGGLLALLAAILFGTSTPLVQQLGMGFGHSQPHAHDSHHQHTHRAKTDNRLEA